MSDASTTRQALTTTTLPQVAMATTSLPRAAENSHPYTILDDFPLVFEKVALYHRRLASEPVTESRLLDLRRYARDRGWDVFAQYLDGKSKDIRGRPELRRLLADAAKGSFDRILVRRLAGFGRTAREAILALDRLRNLGVDFVSLEEKIDTSGEHGEALSRLIGALARLERQFRGRVRVRQQPGRRPGRPPIEVDLDEVRRLHDRGLSLRAIARRLGISKSTVARILRSK